MKKRTIIGICLFSYFFLLSIPLIPIVQSIEVEKEVKTNIIANIKSMKDRLDSFDLFSYLVQLLKLILAIVLLTVSFIISIPGLITLFFDATLGIIFSSIFIYIVWDFFSFIATIWMLFNFIGLYISIPIIINLQEIKYRGSRKIY